MIGRDLKIAIVEEHPVQCQQTSPEDLDTQTKLATEADLRATALALFIHPQI
jgi:hypothetical protein